MPLASASQYPDPFASGAMPIVRSETTATTWLHVTVTSLGRAHDETKTAAIDPDVRGSPHGENRRPGTAAELVQDDVTVDPAP